MASVLFFFSLLYPLLAIFARNPERHFSAIVKCRKLIGLLSSATVGLFYRFHFEDHIDWSKPYIICANHTSNLDITAMVLLCPSDFSFMGKIELLNNPVTRLFFKTIDIPLDRQSKISAFRAFKQADGILRKGRSVVIFPEGQIGDTYPPKLHDFKNGPFKLAIDTQVSILPVVIHNAWNAFWDDAAALGSKPMTINISVLKPFTTDGLTLEDADNLRDNVFLLIKKTWDKPHGV